MTACGEVGRLAQYLLARLGRGVEPDAIASLVSPDVRFEIAGDVGVFPWIGTRIGRRAASDFIRDRRREVEQLRIDVHDVLVSDRRAVILGEVETRVRATGRLIKSAFALILTVSSSEISRLQMLEQMLEDGVALRRADGVVPATGAAR